MKEIRVVFSAFEKEGEQFCVVEGTFVLLCLLADGLQFVGELCVGEVEPQDVVQHGLGEALAVCVDHGAGDRFVHELQTEPQVDRALILSRWATKTQVYLCAATLTFVGVLALSEGRENLQAAAEVGTG